MKKTFPFYLLLIIFFGILGAMLPVMGGDIKLVLHGVEGVTDLFLVSDTALLPAILGTLFVRLKVVKVISYAGLGLFLFVIMTSTVNKKNHVLPAIAFFLFFLLDRAVIGETLTQVGGFANHLVGCLGVLLFFYIVSKKTVSKANYLGLFALGVFFSTMSLPYAFTIFALSVVYICKDEIKIESHAVAMLLGEIFGLTNAVLTMRFSYEGFSHVLIHEFMPSISGTSYIIVIIFSALVMMEGIKLFMRGRRALVTLAILGMSAFLFSSLLLSNDYVNYITYVLYTASSYYILRDMTSSIGTKRKINLYYLGKIVFISMLCIFGIVDAGSPLLLSLLDILIILEIYNYIFPNGYLYPVWLVASVFLCAVNIYIYNGEVKRLDEMNFFIKNKLECTTEDVVIPLRYKNDFLYDYVPRNREEVEDYVEFYGIDVYEPKRDISFRFRE